MNQKCTRLYRATYDSLRFCHVTACSKLSNAKINLKELVQADDSDQAQQDDFH